LVLFENRALRRIFELQSEEDVTGEQLHDKELHDL
jgi:hypothetical protein